MTRRFRPVAAALAVVVAFTPFLAACGEDDDSADGGSTESTETTQATTDESATFLLEIEERGKPELAATESVTELQVTDDVQGTGDEVQAGDTITAHYVGVSASTGEEFDSSWDRGEPTPFPLDGVIPGWSEGLVGMKEGGRRTLVIPPDMAYGDQPPAGSGIAPGETLVFTVDLVSIDS